MPHRIGGSALRAELVVQARGGDPAALEWLICALPRDLPPAVRRTVRDDRIRRLGSWLASELPAASTRHIAMLLATADDRTGGSALLDALASDERARLVSEVRDITRWAPLPRVRQLIRLLQPGSRPVRLGAGARIPCDDAGAAPGFVTQPRCDDTASWRS